MSNKISNNLKKLRAKKGYFLEKVTHLADLSLNTVVKIENGVNKNPIFETITKLAKVLSIKCVY